TIP
ncbi:hypothetical protein AZE42_04065, partial [Rhizopogon vesiculosus]